MLEPCFCLKIQIVTMHVETFVFVSQRTYLYRASQMMFYPDAFSGLTIYCHQIYYYCHQFQLVKTHKMGQNHGKDGWW